MTIRKAGAQPWLKDTQGYFTRNPRYLRSPLGSGTWTVDVGDWPEDEDAVDPVVEAEIFSDDLTWLDDHEEAKARFRPLYYQERAAEGWTADFAPFVMVTRRGGVGVTRTLLKANLPTDMPPEMLAWLLDHEADPASLFVWDQDD